MRHPRNLSVAVALAALGVGPDYRMPRQPEGPSRPPPMTQADFDRIEAARLKRERKAAKRRKDAER